MKTLRNGVVGAVVLGGMLAVTGAHAQAIVDSWPSNTQALAAGDTATAALAQINDAAEAAQSREKVELYKQLMELNGMSRNVRLVLEATKASTRLVVIERAGGTPMTPYQEAQYNQIADQVMRETESTIINDIANAQAQLFSVEEIQMLIASNSTVAAAKYNAAKFTSAEYAGQQIQSYMVQAVVKIVRTFREAVAS